MKFLVPPQNLKPKFKYGDRVVYNDEFYGRLEGTIENVGEAEEGYLFWKKRYLIYHVYAETNSGPATILALETSIVPVPPKLKPVK